MPDPASKQLPAAAFVPAPHRHGGATVRGIMLETAAALLPGLGVVLWLQGTALLAQLLAAGVAAWCTEWCALRLRGRRPQPPPAGDGSVLLTALLFVLCLPPTAAWYVTVSGAVFAVGVVKHCYGGLGQNLFNPAMAGYVFVLLCFPAEFPARPPETAADAISSATPLTFVQDGLRAQGTLEELRAEGLEQLGRGQGWLALAWLAGGAWLLVRRIISWRIPAAVLGALGAAALLAGLIDDQRYPSAWFHWVYGGTMLGAFFIATDPVSSAATPRGQLLYGAGIGLLAWSVRTWGPYAGGVAFAVLMMNACVPLLDTLPHRPARRQQDETSPP